MKENDLAKELNIQYLVMHAHWLQTCTLLPAEQNRASNMTVQHLLQRSISIT